MPKQNLAGRGRDRDSTLWRNIGHQGRHENEISIINQTRKGLSKPGIQHSEQEKKKKKKTQWRTDDECNRANVDEVFWW